MLTKEKIKSTIDSLPDNFSIEDVIEELIVLDEIEQGLKKCGRWSCVFI